MIPELLWTAPEILRKSSDIRLGYSQKGDVYSFAIILQEICTRSEPYSENDLDVNGKYFETKLESLQMYNFQCE